MTDKEFIEDMRSYRIDHLPDGYPCVQTHQIDRLIAIIDQLTIERNEAMKTNGHVCRVCSALRTEGEIMKRTSDKTSMEVANRCAEIAENCPPEVTMFGSCTRCPVVPAIAGAIRKTYGLLG